MSGVTVTLYKDASGTAVHEVYYPKRQFRISTNGVLILLDGDHQTNAWAAGQWRDVRTDQ